MASDTRNPTSDIEVSGTWSGSAGTRYQAVDDHPDSSGADFLTHGTAAGNLLLGHSAFSVPANSTGISVDILYYDRKNASQSCNIAARLGVGGNRYNASSHNPTNGTWVLRTDSWSTNPKTTAAWTVDDVNGVGANALEGIGWVSTDANPAIDLASIQIRVNYTPPTATRGQSSFAELEVPNLVTRGRVSFSEFEVPNLITRGRISFSEFEVPNLVARGLVSFGEFEVPDTATPTRGQASFGELEVPDAATPTRGQLSFSEFEIPFVGTRGRISFSELEVPLTPTRGQLSFSEFEAPLVPTRGELSFAVFEVPIVGGPPVSFSAMSGQSGVSGGGDIKEYY